jgi:serine/threonine protein kinase
MEAALGGGLLNFLMKGRLPENMARMYFKKLMTGISYMHNKSVYHTDLRLDNILLDENLELKITEFLSSIH